MRSIILSTVLACLSCALGCDDSKSSNEEFSEAKVKTTKNDLDQIVMAHATWQVSTMKDCPENLAKLAPKYLQRPILADAWGNKLRMLCGKNAPQGVPLGVVSNGPDGKEGTSDDIKSWE